MGAKNIILLLLLFYPVIIQSQEQDSLKSKEYYIKAIDTIKSPLDKLSNLETILYLLTTEGSEDVNAYLDQYIELATELKKYDEALNIVYKVATVLSNTETFLDYKKKVFPILNKGEPLVFKAKDSLILGNFYGYKAYLLDVYLNDFKESILYYELSLKILPQANAFEKSRVYASVAPVYVDAGFFLKAADTYRKAEKYHESIGDTHSVIHSALGLAGIYGHLGFYEKKIEKYLEVIEISRENEIFIFQHSSYFSLAMTYLMVNDKEKYKEAISQALKFTLNLESDDKNKYLIYIYGHLANNYFDIDDFNKAEEYYELAESVTNKRGKNEILDRYIPVKLEYLFKTKRYNEAITLGEKALIKFKENKSILLLEDTHQAMYKIYKAKENTNKALKNHIAYTSINDSINNVAKSNAFNYYQTLYETEKKKKEIVKKSNEILLLGQENKVKNIFIWVITISAVLIIIIIVVLIKRRQLLKDKKSKEKFSHDLLMTQENERKRISEDLHDGLGQSLLFVKNEIVSENLAKSKKLINSSIEEMRTIARSLYPFQLNNVGVGRAINNLIAQLNDSTNGIYFFTEIEMKEGKLSDLQQVNIFRIVQECLSNIVKHAKGTSAKVTLTTEGQKVAIFIQDNGVGFNFIKKYSTQNTLGLKTIQERVNFLKGTLKIDSKKGQGTSFSIIFPITT